MTGSEIKETKPEYVVPQPEKNQEKAIELLPPYFERFLNGWGKRIDTAER